MEKKFSIEYVADVVNEEGMDYAVLDYLDYEEIENKELSDLIKSAHDSLKALKDFFYKNLGGEWEY